MTKRRISVDGLEQRMLAAMKLKIGPDGRISEKAAGEVSGLLTIEHFSKRRGFDGRLTPEEITAGKICGKNAMCEINNAFLVEEQPGTVLSDTMPTEPPPIDAWRRCGKGSCHRHERCMYLNHARCGKRP